ncbi:hypothetical protein [Luteimonas fraxinea]|uniref:hypothetical protein n=1 Tax=Luteimonas fraxinea TaxID=2901869 RepID=UPI001E5455DF|nr:hypothetical protein [Luteimonas fraxinea]MCD9125413.1 hypothetical protein [Luteimonas fraxinea]
MQKLKIEIASHFLSGICREDGSKAPQERELELRNALATAEALIRLAADDGNPVLEHAPPMLPPARQVQERTIERETLQELLLGRRDGPDPSNGRGPRLH